MAVCAGRGRTQGERAHGRDTAIVSDGVRHQPSRPGTEIQTAADDEREGDECDECKPHVWEWVEHGRNVAPGLPTRPRTGSSAAGSAAPAFLVESPNSRGCANAAKLVILSPSPNTGSDVCGAPTRWHAGDRTAFLYAPSGHEIGW